MKVASFFIAKVFAGKYQNYKNLTPEEREGRRIICDAKAEETKNAFPIENGSWICPNLGLQRSKILCQPTCEAGYIPDWSVRPKKNIARFMTRCGDPATVARKNLPVSTQLSCSPKPPHPCAAQAASINIEDGQLDLLKPVINKKRANYQVVCDDGQVKGTIHCFNGQFNNPWWNKLDWKNSCAGSCDNPCDGLENCTTFVKGCPVSPVRNTQFGTTPAALSYKVSADIFCDHSITPDGNWKSILHVTGGNDYGSPGDRTFAFFQRPSDQKIHFVVNDPDYVHPVVGDKYHQRDYEVECNDQEWNTYAVEVKRVEGTSSTLKYVMSIDGATVLEGSYDSSGSMTTGELQAFVSDDFYLAASEYQVRNFFYQTCSDPCDGLENCTSFVNSCAVSPVQNTQVGTAPAALSYKVSADIFCDHSIAPDGNWKTILHVTGGNDYGSPGDRTFAFFQRPSDQKIHFVVNDPDYVHPVVGDKYHQRDYEVECNDQEWNTYAVKVQLVEGTASTLQYTMSVDGVSVVEGSYDSSGSMTTGELQAFVSDNFYLAASDYRVRNFFFQTL